MLCRNSAERKCEPAVEISPYKTLPFLCFAILKNPWRGTVQTNKHLRIILNKAAHHCIIMNKNTRETKSPLEHLITMEFVYPARGLGQSEMGIFTN